MNATSDNRKQSPATQSAQFEGTISKGGWYGLNSDSNPKYLIFADRASIDAHIATMMTNAKNDTAIVPEGYYENMQKEIQNTYAAFDDAFFAKNKLVLAVVDSGAGNTKYTFENASVDNNTLTATVKKEPGLISTMDYVSFILQLRVDKQLCFDTVQITLNQPTPTAGAPMRPVRF
ncbi:MAG: hypothetical protein FWD76_02030 [Firmicutes bacterium]|nr:hypothetical protein [Bacillota bacterium]